MTGPIFRHPKMSRGQTIGVTVASGTAPHHTPTSIMRALLRTHSLRIFSTKAIHKLSILINAHKEVGQMGRGVV